MIDVHQRLSEAFNTLPLIGAVTEAETKPANPGYKANYKWGDQLHLNQIMKLYNDEKKNPYPLIYNVSNSNSQDVSKREVSCKLSLVLATGNKHTEYHNGQRWATSYKNILFPLAGYIEQLFTKQDMFLWDKNFMLYEFPNYGNNQETETTDIWDALKFETTIIINNNCLNKIFYDTN